MRHYEGLTSKLVPKPYLEITGESLWSEEQEGTPIGNRPVCMKKRAINHTHKTPVRPQTVPATSFPKQQTVSDWKGRYKTLQDA